RGRGGGAWAADGGASAAHVGAPWRPPGRCLLAGGLAEDGPEGGAGGAGAGPFARAVLAIRLGDYCAATAGGGGSLALYRKLGDRSGMAAALNYLAGVEWEHGDLDRAIELCEESLALRRQLGSPNDVAASLTNLGLLLHERKEPRAVELQEEAVSIY